MPGKKILRIIYPVDLITFAYILITGLFIVCSAFKLQNINSHIFARIAFVVVIASLIYFDYIYPSKKSIRFLRHFYPLAFLGYFYPETNYLNNIFFPNLDPWVANLEITIFGGHPSVWFSEYFPWKWFDDLMNFGYLSYYFLIFMVCFYVYKNVYHHFRYVIFMLCMSFYVYYIFFIIFPVAGPQFFLPPPDNQLPDAYIFRELVKLVHRIGEGPTAAFPSSHVGIMCVLWWLSAKYASKLMKWLIPVGILLVLSTVYIKAHYVIDVIAGFLSVPIIYWIGSHTYIFIIHAMAEELKIQFIYEKIKLVALKVWHNPNKKI
jgi:membrane-associated phospholipid phosphatase